MRARPFLSVSCWNEFFYDRKYSVYRWTKETFTNLSLPYGWLWFPLLAVQTDNLSSKLPTQTHQLYYPAWRTSFSDAITSCWKTVVALKLSNVPFSEFFTSTAKINVHKPLNDYATIYWHLLKISRWTLKNSMRCAKKNFFILLMTATSGWPTPEMRFLPEQLRWTLLPKERNDNSLSGRGSNTQASNW